MAENESISVGLESAATKLEQLEKAFNELESHIGSSLQNIATCEDIKEYFHSLERSLKEKLGELQEKEAKLEEKQSETQAMLAEKESAVVAKEHAMLDRLQELKDIAVSAITEAREKYKAASPALVHIKGGKEDKVSTSANGDSNAPITVPEENLPDNKSGESAEKMAAKSLLHSSLKQLCEQVDPKGLLKFISENRKNLNALREELSIVLKSANEPARLVLDALEDFYPPNQPTSQGNENDTALQGLRRSCLVLMESATPILGITEPGGHHPLSSEIKQQAKAIANEWKPKLADMDIDVSSGNTLEPQAFLQLLITFSIAPEFDEDELCKIVLVVSRRRQAPELCRFLGLTHRMPDIIETLANTGRQIDAVHFAHAFQLTERFPPVPLLKAYVSEVSKYAHERTGNTGDSVAQKDAHARELGALRAVIRCIEEYKLQEEYPAHPLQKRVAELEKSKSEKRRMGEISKSRAKRPRANVGRSTPRKHAAAAAAAFDTRPPAPVYNDRGLYYGHSERYPYQVPQSYHVASHSSYAQQANVQRHYHYPEERAPASYGTYMAPPLQSSSTIHGSYMGAAGIQTPSTNHGSYMGSGYQTLSSSDYGGSYPPSGLQPSTNHGSYMGSGYQTPSSSDYGGSYPPSGLQPSHQSYM